MATLRNALGKVIAGLFGALFTIAASQAQESVFETQASHAVIMDYDTGIVLFSKGGDEPMPPASMSKIMTTLMVFERVANGSLGLDETFEVSVDAWERGGFRSGSSTMCLEPGERVSVEDLLRGIIVLSGNDAAITLAENLAGSEDLFAEQMNNRAQELGLENATFMNSTGWPNPYHKISARDLALIARKTIQDHPELYQMYGETEFGFCTEAPSNRYNRNPLLGVMEGVDGLKTGHTQEAGYGLVASRVWNGERRIVVFNGMESESARAREGERLMRAAFSDFRVTDAVSAGDMVGSLPIFFGQQPAVDVVVNDTVTLAYHRRDALNIQAVIHYQDPIKAPVKAGDQLGELEITAPGQPAQRLPVFATADVEKIGMRDRMTAAALHIIRTAGAEEPDEATDGAG